MPRAGQHGVWDSGPVATPTMQAMHSGAHPQSAHIVDTVLERLVSGAQSERCRAGPRNRLAGRVKTARATRRPRPARQGEWLRWVDADRLVPIEGRLSSPSELADLLDRLREQLLDDRQFGAELVTVGLGRARSEERRVGKGGRGGRAAEPVHRRTVRTR